MTRYPTPRDLAEAKLEDVVGFFQHLGLQNQRARKCVALAKAWLSEPPEAGKRYRRLHYPNRGDGKDIPIESGPIADDDYRVAWEVGHLPGIGAYAIDSWRIFCRDRLRGLPCDLPPVDLTEEERDREMKGEWARVLPGDKELRAYLRWRWLRMGWVWDPITGDRKLANANDLAKIENGGMVVEGEGGSAEVLGGDEAGIKKEVDAKHGDGDAEGGKDEDMPDAEEGQGEEEEEEEWMFTASSWELRTTGA